MTVRATSWLLDTAIRTVGAQRLQRAVFKARRRELSSELSRRFGNKVLAGPFKGMTLISERSWGIDGDFVPKIIGSYESNIYGMLMSIVSLRPDVVVNVGCAEGYYAVGLARLLPHARIYAFDTDERARAICRRAASANAVTARLIIDGLCTTDVLAEIISRQSGRVFILMDCEGAEVELLDPVMVPGLARSDILVETHDFVRPGILSELEDKFAASHDLTRISQAGRDPNAAEELATYSETDRWIMVDEGRPTIMTWLACRSRRLAPEPTVR